MKKIVLVFITVTMLLISVGCSDNSSKNIEDEIYTPNSSAEKEEYKTVDVTIGTIENKYTIDGIFDNPNVLNITSTANGTVKKVYIKDGSKVKKGAKLIDINTEEIDTQIEEQRIRLEAANSTYTVLAGNKKTDANELEDARINIELEQNAYDELLRQKEKYTVYAPVTGEITIREDKVQPAKKGQNISQGQVFCTMVETAVKYPLAMVYDNPLENVSNGTKVTVSQNNKNYPGKIINIINVPNGDSSTYYYMFKLDKNLKLKEKDGSFSVIFNIYSKKNAMTVPTDAVHNSGDKGYYVDVLLDGVKVQTDVEIGITDDSTTEITGGLTGEEKIIVN